MKWGPEKSDQDFIDATQNIAACEKLIRRLKRQRTWMPLFAVLGMFFLLALQFKMIGSPLIHEMPAVAWGLFCPLMDGMFMIAFCVVLGLVDTQIKMLLILRAQMRDTK